MPSGARYSGNLRDITFAEVLQLIAEQRETGVLCLRRDKVEKAVTFHEGRPLHVHSSLAREGFLRACVTRGKMATPVAVGLADQALAEGRPPEDVAEALRVLAPDAIATLRQEVQLARLFEVFSWRQGEFFFDLDAPSPDAGPGAFPARPVVSLLLDGARDFTDPARLRTLFRRRMDLIPVMRAYPDKETDGFVLRPTESRIVQAMDRRTTLEEIAGKTTSTTKEVLRLVYVLEILGLLELLDPLQVSQPEAARGDEFKDYTFEVLEFSQMVDRDHPRILAGNYFAILGVPRDVDEETLRRTYYGLAQRYRPEDLYGKAATAVRGRADQIFERFSLAYDTLLDWTREVQRGRREAFRAMAQGLVRDRTERLRAEREFLKARERMELRDLAGARELVEEAARIRDAEGEYQAHLGHLIAGTGAEAQGKDRALAHLKRAVLLDGHCVPAYRFLAEIHEEAGELDVAVDFLKKALRLKPESASLRKALKRLERLSGGSAEGAKQEQQALEKRMQEFLDSRAGLDRYEVLGVSRTATKEDIRHAYFRLAKEFHPDRLANVSSSLANHPLAEKIFQMVNEAYEVLSNDTRRTAHDRGVDVRHQEGEIRKVIEHRKLDELYRRGETAVREGHYPVAQEQFRRLVEADPGNAAGVAYLAYVDHALDGAAGPASLAAYEARFEEAARLRPGSDVVQVLWGRMYKRAGNPSQALAHFQKAIDRNPHCVEALRELRLARMRQDEDRSASAKSVLDLGGLFGRKKK